MAQRHDLRVLGHDLFQLVQFTRRSVGARVPPGQFSPRPSRKVNPRTDVSLVTRALHHDLVTDRVEHVEARAQRREQLRG